MAGMGGGGGMGGSNPWALLGQGIAHTGQYGIAASQLIKGRKLKKSLGARPELTTPEAYTEALNQARMMASLSEMPGQGLMEQKLGASTASGVRQAESGASSSAGLMATIAGLKGSEQAGLTDIGIKGAEYKDLNQQRLQQALWKYGQEEKDQFFQNKFNPWAEKKEEAAALTGAGLQNLSNTLDKTASSFGGAASTGMFNKGTPEAAGQPQGGMSMDEMSSNLGKQSPVQKYMSAKQKGYKGTYNDWITTQSLGFQNNL